MVRKKYKYYYLLFCKQYNIIEYNKMNLDLDFMFCLLFLEKCFFLGYDNNKNRIITEEEEIYIRERNE